MINKILDDRENRYNTIIGLIEEFNLPVVCGKINYPGNNKNTEEAKMAFEALKIAINDGFKEYFIYTTIIEGYDGSSIIGVVNKDALEAKKVGIRLEEEHSLGRIFDIDVYTWNGSSLGREKISKDQRKCIVCGENARVCIKSGNHNLEEVLLQVNKQIRNAF